jgi:lysophospholipid acyltransferase (LPLAT)-like uncharacterized protein
VLLRASCRVIEVGIPRRTLEGRLAPPWLGVFWHDRMVFPALEFRGPRFATLISTHRDGEMLARCLRCFGTRSLRGSTRRRGGEVLLEAVRALESGISVGIAGDGPLGPRHVLQPGVVALAARAGLPAVPLSYAPSRALRFGSWDRFALPLPGSRLYAAYGEPLAVPAELDEVGLAAQCRRLESELARITTLVDETAAQGRASSRQTHCPPKPNEFESATSPPNGRGSSGV